MADDKVAIGTLSFAVGALAAFVYRIRGSADMPYTINGIGTNLCKARGITPWGDCDSVVCLTFFYAPILPLKAVHAFNFGDEQWTGMGTSASYRQIPIRWSLGLLVRAFARRWFTILAVTGGLLLFVAAIGWWTYFSKHSENDAGAVELSVATSFTIAGLICLLTGLGFPWFMKLLDRRNVDIRYILGCHAFGSSDPAHWPDDLLNSLPGPIAIFNAPSYVRAVEEALENGDWTGAMWAARLCTALENRAEGESLTDRVLNHTHVQAALAAVKRNVELWNEQMTAGKGAVQLWPAAPSQPTIEENLPAPVQQ